MARTKVAVTPKKVTIYANGAEWVRFVKKCKKAKVGVSARVRELVAQDLKV